jgi:hypothetical protein
MTRLWQRFGSLLSVLVGVALVALGLLALNHIVNNYWPIDVARLDLVRAAALGTADAPALLDAANTEIVLAFLAAIMVAATGLVLPLAYLLNRRLRAGSPPPAFFEVLRQSMWVGVWLAFCAWLQMNRTLGIAIALLVAIVLFMFELLLQVRQRAEHGAGQSSPA